MSPLRPTVKQNAAALQSSSASSQCPKNQWYAAGKKNNNVVPLDPENRRDADGNQYRGDAPEKPENGPRNWGNAAGNSNAKESFEIRQKVWCLSPSDTLLFEREEKEKEKQKDNLFKWTANDLTNKRKPRNGSFPARHRHKRFIQSVG